MPAKFAIGIDLGTTNTVLAYTEIDAAEPSPQLLLIPQLTAASQIESLPSLPSFVYLAPHDHQSLESISIAPAFGDCPYASAGKVGGNRIVVGEFARRASAENPEHTIVAAKSWLCHPDVDRHGEILPWGAELDVDRISPVQASRLILQHVLAAWRLAFPDYPFREQRVTLTVPASFDLAARELTFQAAREAGLPDDFVALEEPQAAVYHWISKTGEHWRRQLRANDRIFVCDVGGGTTDLAMMQVDEDHGELTLRRIAVGNHLLVGGDNMDLALAHFAANKFSQNGTKLNAWQSMSLWHAARNAKEALLSGSGQQEYTISVLGRGSRLIGGTVSTALQAHEVEQVLIEGFFPVCSLHDRPQAGSSSGFQEIGLPFEQDTAITRHVAAFLAGEQQHDVALPSKLLFNGGVFKSKSLRERMQAVFAGFQDGASIDVLGGVEDLDAAVAKGAAYYAWSKDNGGVRIRGGTARSYYVGIESAGLAVPGMPRPLTALCVVPKGMEEGTDTDVPSREIGLVVGQEASFRFFASALRGDDRVGTTLKYWDEDELVESAALSSMLEPSPNFPDQKLVPVKFHSKITELGMFELWCISQNSDQRWKLELNVRSE